MFQWQYNGVAPWFDVIDWCNDTFSILKVFHSNEMIYFTHEEDYALFLLRWA